ncbi:hypothetical protein EDB85DRAFT_1975628, partial [Lactarius pseudohatsudake]
MLSWSRISDMVCTLCICWRPGDIRPANIRNPILNPLSPEAATISTTVWFAVVGMLNNPLVLGLGPHSRPHTSCKCSQRSSRPIVQLMPQGPTLAPVENAPLMLSYVIPTGKTLIRGLRPRNRRELSGHVVMMLAPPFVSIMTFSKTLGRTFWLMPRDRICTEQA